MKQILITLFTLIFVTSFSFAEPPQQESMDQIQIQKTTGVSWKIKPIISDSVLHNFPQGEYQLQIMMYIDIAGNISRASINRSSGIKELDNYVVQQVLKAKFHPYIENDQAHPFKASQPFTIKIPAIKEKSLWRKLFWH